MPLADITIARWPEYFKRVFGLKDTSPGKLLPGIVPVFLANAGSRAEEDFLRGERRFMSTNAAVAVAAQFSFVRIENPTPNQLVVVDACIGFVTGSPASARGCRYATTRALGVGSTAGADTRAADGRIGGQAGSGVDIRQGTRAASLGIGLQLATTGTVVLALPAILPPGWSVDVEDGTANEGWTASFMYRVIPIEPSELTGATP